MRRFGLPALIAMLALLLYIPSWGGDFLNYDDDHNFTGNLSYRGLGPANLKWMFTNHYGHYVPLTWLTHGLDYVLFGMNPLGYRVVNSLYHALNAVLVYLIFLSLIRAARPDREDLRVRWAAAIGALFFALHPLRAASVAWITERRDMVSGMFFLLTILTYLRCTTLPPGSAKVRAVALSCLCFVGMLLSKTLGMTVPFVLLILDVWPLRRPLPFRTLLIEKIPYLVLMAGGLILTSMTQGSADTIYTRDQYPLIQSLMQPGFRVTFYIAKTMIPFNLSPLYFYRPEIGLPQILGWALILATTAILIVRRKQLPAILVAWLSYGLLIAPVSGLVQAGPHYAQDSWTYVTCLPFAALFAALIVLPDRPAPFAAAGVAVLVALSLLTVRQSLIWKSSTALWEAAIRIDPDVYYSWHNLGRAKAERGDLDGAIAAFSRSIELRSGFPDPWHARGVAWVRKNRHDLALKDLVIATSLDPNNPENHFHLGLSLSKLGKTAEAMAAFSRAIELRPGFPDALVQRARLRALTGNPKAALTDIDAALRISPTPANHLERSTIRAIGGDLAGAIDDCTEAIRMKPDYVDAYVRRGVARLDRGERTPAAEDFSRALQLAPADWPQRAQVAQFLKKAQE
jgi:tetratricopeptide (TPR) repeat protein